MNLKNTFLLIALILLTISCKKTDWRENFRERSKAPFGTYIIANELEGIFKPNDFISLQQHIYDHFIDIYYDNEADYANYLCVKSYAYRLDNTSIDRLLSFVAAGNDMFLSLNYFDEYLKEQLQFDVENLDEEAYTVDELRTLGGIVYLNGDNFEKNTFTYDRNLRRNYFTKYDTINTTVLGTQKIGPSNKQANFIKVKHEQGNIYLHTQPIAFTNYYLLKDKHEYVENVLSYLPDNRTIIWDPQVKFSKNNKQKDDTSPLKFFMKHPTLKWALYIAFIGLLTFLLLNARRKQRAIPELKALKNSTQDFTHTIANLYLKEDNHKNLVTKKITYFLEKIRTNYHLDTRNLNTDFIEKLAAKSGNTVQSTKYLINTITTINKRSQITQDELVRLNTLIENFFKQKQ